MIDLVQEGPGEEILAFDFEDFAFYILGADHGFFGTAHGFPEAGNAETALFSGLLALFLDDFRIDQNDPFRFRVILFGPGDIDHGNPFAHVDLRGRKANAMSSIHCFEHVLNQLMQLGRIEFRDWSGRALEDWIVQIAYDLINHLKNSGPDRDSR